MTLTNRVTIAVTIVAFCNGCNFSSRKSSYDSKKNEKPAVNVLTKQVGNEKNINIAHEIAHYQWFAESKSARAILLRVERGDPQALASYSTLRDTANAEWTEDLDMSVAEALPHNPEAVLAMADTPDKLDRFCAVPFIEPTDIIKRDFVRAALAALRMINSDSPVAGRRDACVKLLRAM